MLKQIISLQHPTVKHLVKLRQNRDYRYEHHSLVIEGIKMIEEVGRQGPLKLLMAVDESLIPSHVTALETLIVSEEVLQKASGLQHPEGLLAEAAMPKSSTLNGLQTIVVLDGINDPGNLGSLLRTALAMGWQGAFIVNESCDPYNEKALRAARGATFRLPLAMGSWDDVKTLANAGKASLVVADLQGDKPEAFQGRTPLFLVLSNEAHGPSQEALKGSLHVAISMPGPMESLNVAVAGGILMYCLRPC